ncbi:MAG: sugar isomerase [Planctomycetaceae bacterium]|jgi:glucosamine--fructose-6-phosphate aminotransferase (isomerizing)|nr:sugar isomerase [Planctomycetaceae bacterium]
MNLKESRYSGYHLVCEMYDSLAVAANFDFSRTCGFARVIADNRKLLLTGEGSSRIFPAKNFIYQLRTNAIDVNLNVMTEGCYQSLEYDLSDWSVVVASNSGQTGEAVALYRRLRELNHKRNFVVTAGTDTKLSELANETLVLSCGAERAVAATKSVVEQALVYLSILHNLKSTGKNKNTCANNCNDKESTNAEIKSQLQEMSKLGRQVMDVEYDLGLIERFMEAETLYFAGRNNGVAEELALKANEITRKRSFFLDGTYLLHGVEEVMSERDVVVLVEPFEPECVKIDDLFVKKHKIPVISISDFAVPFPTIEIPKLKGYDQFLQLFAGWNLLVQAAVRAGINPDKPTRARKIGNKFDE